MTRYASNTSVSVEKSKAEIERTLGRYGATSFAYGWEEGVATIGFKMHERFVRFNLVLPTRSDFRRTPTGKPRSAAQADKAYEQACRSAWRALALVVKAKLESVETGITNFEEEFLAHLMLPGGETVGQALLPQIDTCYRTGAMPKLLPYGGSP